MQDKKNLKEELVEMHERLKQLYQDADLVRVQVNKEIVEFKKN